VLVLAVAVAGFVFGEEAVRGSLMSQFQALMGETGASAIETMIENAALRPETSAMATVLAVATMLFGASGAFGQLQVALNQIWDVEEKPRSGGVWRIVRNRLLSFGMVMVIAFLLLVSLVVASLVSALDQLAATRAPLLQPAIGALQMVASLVVATGLFAAMYKVLPDRELAWGDVWVGAAATAVLFEIGKSLIGLYIGNSGAASMYGAAGSLVVVLIWIYYSSQIVFLGAEFTQVWSRRRRGGMAPAS
jgi:membrane protein